MKTSFKRIATTAALTVALGVTISAAPAFAISKVDCGNHTDFLRMTVNYKKDYCYANKGRVGFTGRLGLGGIWVSKISTGNNDIWWLADGKWHWLSRNMVHDFPTVGTVKLQAVEIA